MMPQPPTQEQFELLEDIARIDERDGNPSGFCAQRAAALRAVLAYARLGVETYRLVDEAGMLVDRRDGIKSVRKDAGVRLAFELLETIEALGLLAPAVETKESTDG